MNSLFRALDILSNSQISASQTTVIDAALSDACPKDIPEERKCDVINYIDVHLLHNSVSSETRSALERLQEQLRSKANGTSQRLLPSGDA